MKIPGMTIGDVLEGRSNVVSDDKLWDDVMMTVLKDCRNEYAKSYAAAGFGMRDPDYQRAQALYILCNIGGWRGGASAEVRRYLKLKGHEGETE
jgi:hypothetical protein